MINSIRDFIIVFTIFMIIDLVWIFLIIGPIFAKDVYNIQKSPMKVNLISGFIAYNLLAFGIVYFSLPKVNKLKPYMSSLINGGLLGLVIYGVFDMTNLSIFTNYSWATSMIDISWGVFVCFITTYLSHLVINKLNSF